MSLWYSLVYTSDSKLTLEQGVDGKALVESVFGDYTNAHQRFLSAYLELVQHLQDPDALTVYDRYSAMFR